MLSLIDDKEIRRMTGVDLQTEEFPGNLPGPHLLITGGVHGDEFEPIAAIRKLSTILDQKRTTAALKHGEVTLVPCVNYEAFLQGTRCASDGLDLARTCPGRPDGTITERTAFALGELIRTADYYIDLHTGGTEFSIYPLTGYMLHSDPNVLTKQRRMAAAFGLPVTWGSAANLDGRSLSVARDANVPAIYCEHGGSAVCSPTGVDAYVEGCLNVMSNLQMIEPRPAAAESDWHVEDDRDNSGHLQICNPSPVDGFFEPFVELGQEITAGTMLGTVVGLKDDSSHTIRSEHAGIVLMLRTFPRVHAGESVGVVLDTSFVLSMG